MQRGVGGYIEGKEEEKNRLSSLSSGGAHGGCFGWHTGHHSSETRITGIPRITRFPIARFHLVRIFEPANNY